MHEEASHPLPDDPALASAASAFESAGYWAEVVDCQWRYAYVTDDLRLSFGGLLGRNRPGIALACVSFGS